MKKYSVFISYSRKDEDRAKNRRAVKSTGAAVILDKLESGSKAAITKARQEGDSSRHPRQERSSQVLV